MATNENSLDYVLLWDVSDNSTTASKVDASYTASQWPGPPANPISPNPINVNVGMYMSKVKPVPSLNGRKTRRGVGYAGLSNYNNMP